MFRKPEPQGFVLPDAKILTTPEKGNGVYASRKYLKHEIIERAPTLKFHVDSLTTIQDMLGSRFILTDYVFLRGKACHCALGWVAVYNHSEDPNAWWTIPEDHTCIEVRALRDIEAGEEITHAYVRSGDRGVWFDVVESSSTPEIPTLGLGEPSSEWGEGSELVGRGIIEG